MAWQQKIKEVLNVKEGVSIASHTTLGVGGICEFYFEAKTSEELMNAVVLARNTGTPYRVIGTGSNIVASDGIIRGLVIADKSSDLKIDTTNGRVVAASGVPLARLILEAASHSLGGLEPLFGIPGTVGGAIAVNAGAHSISISQFLKSSSVLISSEKILSCKGDWFKFGYRTSRLKETSKESPPVIINAIFQLQRRKKEDILESINKYKSWRQKNQPIGFRTCGSIFKNPVSSDDAKGDDVYKTAGYLLDQAQAKKLSVGGAHVSKIHANWIVNTGKATGLDVRQLIEKMREAVEEKFSVTLIEEVEYLGIWNDIEDI